MSTLKPRLLLLFCITFCLQYYFSQTKVYDVKETTLHLEDTIVYLRNDMIPITGVIQGKNNSNKKIFEVSYLKGKKSGPMKLWCSNGQLILSGNYYNGVPNGSFEWYYSSGKINAKCNYFYGKPNGKCQGWYEEHDQLKYEENYQLGALFGVQRYFSQDGVSLGGGDLVNGNGKLILYYPNKTIALENLYLNGLLTKINEYSLNGKIQSIVEYQNGKLNGKCLFWDESDHEIAELNYLCGEKHGTNKEFYRDGKNKLEEHYLNGVLDSVKRKWSDKEKLIEESFWENGINVSSKYWNENGELLSKAPSTEGFDLLAVIVSDLSNSYQINSTHSIHFNSLFKDGLDELVYMLYPSNFMSCDESEKNVNLNTTNPFGNGGNGVGIGGGNGPFDGNGSKVDSFGDVKYRIRINDPILPKYNTKVDLKVHLKLTVDGEGNVVNAECIKDKTTTDDQTIINDLIRQVIRQVKYKKDPEGKLAYCYLTVKVNAL